MAFGQMTTTTNDPPRPTATPLASEDNATDAEHSDVTVRDKVAASRTRTRRCRG